MKRKEKWNEGAATKEEIWQPSQQYLHKKRAEKREKREHKD